MAATPTNAMNLNSTISGLVNWDGNSVMSVTPLTQFCTLAAGSNKTLAMITPGTVGQVLTSAGPGAFPSYQTPSGGDVVGPSSSTDNALVRWDGTTGKLIQNGVTIEDDTGNISQSVAVSGGTLSYTLANSSNTASAQAKQVISVGGGTADDAFQTFTVTGVTNWSQGIDNSVSDSFVLSASTALGTTNVISSTTSGNVSFVLGNTDVTRASSGGTVQAAIVNTSNTASSDARLAIQQGGASGGDAYISYIKNGANEWTQGLNVSDSASFVLSANSALGTTNVIRATTAGEVTKPLQPAFLAYLPSSDTNATGDGTAYTLGEVTALTEIYDQGNDFNPATGVFTAPVTGRYMFTAGYAITNVGVGHTRLLFYSPATSRQATVSSINPFIVLTSNGFLIMSNAFYLDMTAGDTAKMIITVYNSTKTVTVYGDSSLNTYFGGSLIC